MDNSAAVSQPPLASQSHSQESFISNLRTFSNSLSAFQQCFSDIQQHIGSIRTSIDSILLPLQTTNTASPLASAPDPEPEPEPEPSWESDPSEDLEEDVEVEEKREKEEEEVNSPHSEFKSSGSELKSSHSELKSPGSEFKSHCLELKSLPSELISPGSELNLPGSELSLARSEFKLPGSELESLRSKLKSLGSALKLPGSELESLRSKLKSPGSALKLPGSELNLPGSELESLRSELKSSGSALKSPGSELSLPGSEFKLPGSALKWPGSELKSPRSELEIICKTMDNLGLRKYMITNLSDIHRLRVEVLEALKLSPSPTSLVFKCIGKFYNKGSKAYANNTPLIQERKAKVLLLECFLMMMGIDDNKGVVIEKWVKEEAEQAALAWLKRINIEKGVVQAQEIDARGLLLFIGCFGIPGKFKNKNISNLLQVSNLNWISDAIRRSNVLMGKIPEIIDEMLANKMVVKAVHIVYSVGMQDRFNPKTLLMSFLRESKSSFDKMQGSQGANKENIGVKRKYMNDLKSIIKCLGRHNIDPSKLLGAWQINTRIMSLEKEIAEFNRQIADQKATKNAGFHKRKIDETEWLSNKEVKRSHFSNPWPPQQQQRVVVNHVVSNNTLLEGGGTSGQNYGYSMFPPVLHGPIADSIHGNVVGSLAGPVGGVAMGGPGILPSPQGGSYAGGHGGTRVDSTPGQIGSHAGQLYGLRGNAYRPVPYMESSNGLPNTIPGDANRPPPYLESSKRLPNTIPGNACRPAPWVESSKGLPNTIPGDTYRPMPCVESSKGLPNTIPGDAYRSPPYLEGSTGLLNTTPSPHQFANPVPAAEQNQSSGSQAVVAHPSSSLNRQI